MTMKFFVHNFYPYHQYTGFITELYFHSNVDLLKVTTFIHGQCEKPSGTKCPYITEVSYQQVCGWIQISDPCYQNFPYPWNGNCFLNLPKSQFPIKTIFMIFEPPKDNKQSYSICIQ